MNLPHHRRCPLQRLHQQFSTFLHLPGLLLLRLTRLRTRIPRSNLRTNPLTHTTDPLTQTSRTLGESILQHLSAGFPENQPALRHASAPHPTSNPRTRRHKTLPLLPIGARHITINSHQRIRVSLKISSKRPQRIHPPRYHITQTLSRGTSYQRRMLRHNIRQQRQAILGLITSPHNNSSRTLLSPKLQLHMGTHVAPLPHASDPQSHKSAAPTAPDRAGHTHPNPNHLPETGRSFPLTTTLRTSTTTALLPLARFGGPPCPNATTPAKGSRRDPWSDGFDTDCSFVAVRLNHPLPPVPVGVRTAAGPPCFSGRPR